jgi:hypothetical protein|tara:strand:+ start:1353 stop:1529 length:177 start_codon:yes stop_codon:yes gene_type:complete
MKKNLQSNEVIESISKKIDLKQQLRDAKKSHDDVQIEKLSQKISKIEDKLHSRPLSKT